ncbi:MAG: glycosyltransferase [Bacteroidota bacterium]
MKILYVSYDGMTDPLGRSQVIPYLEGLSRAGHEICLMSCEKPGRFEKFRETIQAQLDRASIKWVPLHYTSSPPVISTVMDIMTMRKNAQKLYAIHHFDVVHCRSYIAAFTGLAMKQKFGCQFVFDMRGLWADERVDGGLWNLKNPLFKTIFTYFKKKERDFLLAADKIISLTNNAKSEISGWDYFKGLENKIQVIPCCCDMALFDKTKTQQSTDLLRKKLQISGNDFIVSYLGSIGTWYLTDEMIRFFTQMKTVIPSARFLYITQDDKEIIINKSTSSGIPGNDIFVIAANRDEVPALLGLSNISLFFVKQAYSKKASSPTKMGEIMSMGIPLICNSGIGDVDRILQDAGVGLVVGDFSEDTFSETINNISGLLTTDPAYIRSQAAKFYSLETGINLYEKVYDELSESVHA